MKILIKRKGALGDVINTTPVARRLRQENPEAQIDVATYHTRAYFRNPHIDNVVNPDTITGDGYDLTVDLNGSYESERNIHHIDKYMLTAFGNTDGDKSPVFEPSAVSTGFESNENVIVVHPAVSWPSRTFPTSFWQDLVNLLDEAGYTVIVTGTSNDQQLTGVIDTRGRFGLDQQARLIDWSKAFICSDSGLMALAATTEVPIVALLTITKAEFAAPYRYNELGWNFYGIKTPLSCHGCAAEQPPGEYFTCKRGDNACVTSIKPKDVVDVTINAIFCDRRNT